MSLLLLISILPIILIGFFIYIKDKNKEPNKMLIKLFLGGILACFITLALTSLLENNFLYFNNNIYVLSHKDFVINILIKIAFIEEISKWFILFILSYKSINFDEKYDMLIYATFVALGFAGFENVIYGLTTTYEIAILRGFTAVPFHVCLGIIMGSNLLLAKISRLNKDKKREIKYIIFSILIPVLVHGLYDYILMKGNKYFIFILFILLIILFIYIIKKINKISAQKQTLLKK